MSDRLADLAGCRAVLRHNRIDSLDAYRAVTPEQVAGLHKYGPMIKRLVEQADPAVLAALWPPASIDWSVCQPGPTADVRSVNITYRVGRDGDEGEKRAWKALKAALAAGDIPLPA
jgi:hypothetical protein